MAYYFGENRWKLDFNGVGLKYSQTQFIIKIRNMKHDNTCQSWPLEVLNFGDTKEDYIIMQKNISHYIERGRPVARKPMIFWECFIKRSDIKKCWL